MTPARFIGLRFGGAKLRKRETAKRLLGGLALVVLVPVGIAWVGFAAAVAWWPYPAGIDRPPVSGTFLLDRGGAPLGALVAADGQWHLPLSQEQIGPHLFDAIVAVEDGRFRGHRGVDWRSVVGALYQDVRHLGVRRGGSTLTMQLQRLRDPKPRTIFNKLDQAVRAEQLEKHATKNAILLEYLNRAPFGGNLVGAGAASWRYFGRPCRDLSLGEAALLAGLPQSPNRLRPDRHPEAARARRNHVLNRMLALGMIDARHRDEATAEPIGARWLPLPQDDTPEAMPAFDAIARRHPGQVVRTTLDRTTERRVAEMTATHLATLRPSGVSAGAVVVLDTASGECLAAISSQPQSKNRIDLTRRPRSSGSTLKPFIYAAAFDAGVCTPKSIVFDTPSAWAGYVPNNFDRSFHGPMPAGEALSESRNIPALVLLGRVGVERTVGILQSFGFGALSRARRPYGLSLAIGGAEATPLELAEAYATLGRGGVWKKVTFALGESSPERRVMRAAPCWETLKAISGAERTEAVSAAAAALGVAWKTGTSSGHRDAWCVAVTPRRTVVVWLGNPGGGASAALVGQEAAAPLALRLIATLDDGGEGWPDVLEVVPAARKVVAAASNTSLVILSPARNQQVLLSPDVAAERQQVLFESNGEGAWWFVDDAPVGRGSRVWWSPSVGTHRVRVVDDEGHFAAVGVRVDKTAD